MTSSQPSEQLFELMQEWSLTDPVLLASTATSNIFKVQRDDGCFVLKILTDVGFKDERHGASFLRAARGEGVVKLEQFTDRAHLLEYVDGEDLRSLSDVDATREFCKLLPKLHKQNDGLVQCELIPLKVRYSALLEADVEALGSNHRHVVGLAKDVAERLLRDQSPIVPLHGDLHHENILRSSSRGWIAIDPKGLQGDPVYDVANWFYNPSDINVCKTSLDRIHGLALRFSEVMRVPPNKILDYAFSYGVLSALWSRSDGLDFNGTLAVVQQVRGVREGSDESGQLGG